MKVLVIIPSLHRGGAERVVSLLSQEWAKQHHVKLAVFDATTPAYAYGGELIDLGLAARAGLYGKLENAITRIRKLYRLIHDEQPDRIISFMESANFPAILASLLAGKRRQLSVSVRNDPTRFNRGYRIMIPYAYRLPDQVIAVSAGVGQALAKMGVPAQKIRAIPNPAIIPATGNLQPENAIEALKPFILGVGRLHRQKGFDRLLEAFAAIGHPRLKLVILGEGQERAALEKQARDLGIDSQLLMPGAVADPSAWYRAAECFVLSSRHEGWPNVLMEAMANGCPVVSFDCNYGPSEIIVRDKSGLIVEQETSHELKNAINLILKNEDLKLRLAQEGKKRVATFDISEMSQKWL